MMATEVLDQVRAEAFGQRIVETVNSAALSLMISIGHRTGLFDTLADMPPATSVQIAEQAGLSERYVREWLGAMLTGGVVEYDAACGTYWLPPEHAASLTRDASPNNAAVFTQWIAVMGGVEDQVVEAFSHGRGVPYSAYHRFHEVMAEESGQTVVAALLEHILPLVDGLSERLEAGIDVLDIGCGAGRALIELAAAFPASRFTGYDFSEEGIAAARAEARRRELNNIRFEVRDVAEVDEAEAYDLVTAFDAVHDQARPARVLRNVAAALRPDGVFLMQDIAACSHVHGNLDHPVGTLIYTISCMHCMSVSLAHGGPGLGAAWGREKALEMLRDAGFRDVSVRTLDHDIMNYYYIARPRK
jgi:2-polyprenyl-3-methyl-5-hydroxy-6-metoxy-1,4-benzoquinol methylase